MNFEQSYSFLLSLSNMSRKEYMAGETAGKWYMKRLKFFLDMLGNPEKNIPHYIHVTGTSGKGSVTSFLHSILEASGKQVGATFSPHPSIITERWKIGNRYMSKQEFAEIVSYLKPKLDEYIQTTPYDMLSFFELTEVIGFLYFKKHKVDWLVLEVGCGGRYDSSNIIPYKDVAVITNIGLDHVSIIGNNKTEIAYEKSGIIKKGCAVFTSEKNKELCAIIQKECDKEKVELHISHNTHHIPSTYDTQQITFEYKNYSYTLSVQGLHQIKNAILCIDIARYLNIPIHTIQKGLQRAHQPLRMEVIQKNPLIILDGAHNVDKIKTTVATIQSMYNNLAQTSGIIDNRPSSSHLHLIIGMSANKQLGTMIKELAKLNPTTIAITRNTANIFRKTADLQELKKLCEKYCTNKPHIKLFLDPLDAYHSTKQKTKKCDILLVTGSIYLSGELRKNIKKNI